MDSILFLILAGLVAIFAIAFTGCGREPSGSPARPALVSVNSIQSLSKAEIDAMLRDLESREAPKPQMGAMCYEMALPPERAEYVCPKCGEKTLYTKDEAAFVDWELPACRRQFGMIQNSTPLSLSLDESSFCEHCSPGAKRPQLVLKIVYSDGSVQETSPMTLDDLYLLKGFLGGELSYENFYEGREPLKDQIPRLRQLLGVKKGDK